jgi:hypothetical protein
MSLKISQYTTSVSALASGDLMDVSKLISTSPDVYSSDKLNYSVLLTEIIADGSILTGSGTTNFISKFSSSGTLANSSLRDDGSNVSINNVVDASYKLYINSDKLVGLGVFNNAVSGTNNFGISGSATNANTGSNVGVFGNALLSSAGTNLGVRGQSASQTVTASDSIVAAGSNVGGFFQANASSGISYGLVATADATTNQASATFTGAYIRAFNAGTKYSVRLVDGSEGTGKFLKSVTSSGEANWAALSITDITASLGTSLQVVRMNAAATALEYATLSSSNLGNANLTADAAERSYTLFGNTSSDKLIFQNLAGTDILNIYGDKKIGFLTNQFTDIGAGTSNINFGDTTTPSTIAMYFNPTANYIYSALQMYCGAYKMHNVDGRGRFTWLNSFNGNADIAFYLDGGTSRIITNSYSTSVWQDGYTHSHNGNQLVTIRTENSLHGQLILYNSSAQPILLTSSAGTAGYLYQYSNGVARTLLYTTGGNYFLDSLCTGVTILDPILAQFHVKGNGSTSSTTTALFQNSSSVNALKIRDDNYLIQRAINAAIADADLSNNEMSAYINESTSFIIFKVKTSTGVVKTASIALV